METKVLFAVTAALVSSMVALHAESALAGDAAASAYEDSTVDASLDPGEERVSAGVDKEARLKAMRDAYYIGYTARAIDESKPYASTSGETKRPQKQFAAPAISASPKRVAEQVAPPRRITAQPAILKQVSTPATPPKRLAIARVAPGRLAVAEVQPVEPKPKRIPTPVPQKHIYAQVESVPAKHPAAPVASFKLASMQVASPKRVEAQPASLKLASARTTPLKLSGTESEPPILIPTQAVTSLPGERSDNDDNVRVTQKAQRAVPQYRQADEESQYVAEQSQPTRQYQNRQPQQYAAASAYSPASTERQDQGEYAGQEYAPPPRRHIQANQYAPGQYQPAYAQSTYVPRPPPQAMAQQVVIMARPSAYSTYNPMYPQPAQRQPYPTAYGNPAQPAGYRGWE